MTGMEDLERLQGGLQELIESYNSQALAEQGLKLMKEEVQKLLEDPTQENNQKAAEILGSLLMPEPPQE